MVNRKRLFQSVALLTIVLTSGMIATTASAAPVDLPPPPNFWAPTVTQVSERAKATIGVFRKSDPVTLPEIIASYGAPDPPTGQTMMGLNVALARPAFPRGNANGKPHYWLIPAATNVFETGDFVAVIELDGKGREREFGGLTAKIDDRFAKHGTIFWSHIPPGSKKRTSIRGLVPDSVKSFKVTTKRKGKKSLTKTYQVRDNTILLDVKNPTHIIIKGKKFKNPLSNKPIGDGEGTFAGFYP